MSIVKHPGVKSVESLGFSLRETHTYSIAALGEHGQHSAEIVFSLEGIAWIRIFLIQIVRCPLYFWPELMRDVLLKFRTIRGRSVDSK